MSRRDLTHTVRSLFYHSRIAQIGVLVGFWWFGEMVVRSLSLPVPGGVVGMVLVLALLLTKRVSLFSFKRGADWFLAEMLLFFVPAVLALLDHREFIGLTGLKILAVILIGTLTVMSVTALTVDFIYSRIKNHADR